MKAEIGERKSFKEDDDEIFGGWIVSELRKLNADEDIKTQLRWLIQKAVASTTNKYMSKFRTNRPIRSTRYQ